MDDPPDKVTVQHNYPQAAQIFCLSQIDISLYLSQCTKTQAYSAHLLETFLQAKKRPKSQTRVFFILVKAVLALQRKKARSLFGLRHRRPRACRSTQYTSLRLQLRLRRQRGKRKNFALLLLLILLQSSSNSWAFTSWKDAAALSTTPIRPNCVHNRQTLC